VQRAAHHGEKSALTWAKGIVGNMARPPKGNDRKQLEGAALGACDIAIANSYYFGAWVTSDQPEIIDMSKKLGVFFPNQNERGAHMNISGAGITKHSKNTAEAVQLLEYLSSSDGQDFYANINHEYPVNPSANVSELVKSWGHPIKEDSIAVEQLGKNNPLAIKLFDRADWK
ncbi:MAG: extracellular solute-binding protein, partial [Pseudomonadota bacterium]